MKKLGVILITLALVAGLLGCPAGPRYTLTVLSTAGGSVTTPGEGTFPYGQGTAASLVATPDVGFRFVEWTGDVDTIADVRSATTTIAMNGDYSVTANFVAVRNLTVTSSAGGSVTAPGEGVFTYEEGTVVSLAAQAEEDYRFARWTGDVGTVANVASRTSTIVMNGDYSVTANYVAVYELTVSSTEGGWVTAPGEGTFTYDEGAVVGLVAVAEVGYRFIAWSGAVDGVADVEARSTTLTMTSPCAITANFGTEEAVFFADGNLEAAVREAIGVPERPIYPSDLEELATLTASGRSIVSIDGLEHAANLKELNLYWNEIVDISPLAGLTRLTWLGLHANQISDLSPLVGLTNLTTLIVGANQVSDISPLAGLTSLTLLYLHRNQISDVGPLADLTSLIHLALGVNNISDISPVAGLTNLTHLWLWDNDISDVSPVANLTRLIHLNFYRNKVEDISALADLTALEELHIQYNHIEDISPLTNLAGLTGLWIRGNELSDISPLQHLTSLTELNVGENKIGDISPLAYLTQLRLLRLSDNEIADIGALYNLTDLRGVWLDNNRIADISPLSVLTRIGEIEEEWWRQERWLDEREGVQILLGLSSNQITDIRPLLENAGLSEGDGVDLRGNPLGSDALHMFIPELVARGVNVLYG